MNRTFIYLVLLALWGCNKEYQVKYATGHPNRLVGNWIAYEFPDGRITPQNRGDYYTITTALDPANSDSLIIDNIYDSRLRVKAHIDTTSFRLSMAGSWK
ncbi:MAG: hypothetical protein HC896_17325 [Bacteroidales bacterium]|nr:hypothetical protein [Bacteroidales bacterium]